MDLGVFWAPKLQFTIMPTEQYYVSPKSTVYQTMIQAHEASNI